MKDDKIIEKIKKLLAYQADAEKRNALPEAVNAAQRIQDLLMKHNLDMSSIENDLNKVTSDIMQEFVKGEDLGYDHRYGKWIENLAYGVGKYNLCRVIIHSNPFTNIPKIAVIGRPENVEIVKYLILQVVNKALAAERSEWRYYGGFEKRGKWRRGFLMGFAMGVTSKLREQWAYMQKQQESCTALVKVMDKAIDSFVDTNYSNLGKMRKHGNHSAGAYSGFQAGQSTDLNKGVNTNVNALNQQMLNGN